MKILIAEDDALFRRTLEELLLPAYELQVARMATKLGPCYSVPTRPNWLFSMG